MGVRAIGRRGRPVEPCQRSLGSARVSVGGCVYAIEATVFTCDRRSVVRLLIGRSVHGPSGRDPIALARCVVGKVGGVVEQVDDSAATVGRLVTPSLLLVATVSGVVATMSPVVVDSGRHVSLAGRILRRRTSAIATLTFDPNIVAELDLGLTRTRSERRHVAVHIDPARDPRPVHQLRPHQRGTADPHPGPTESLTARYTRDARGDIVAEIDCSVPAPPPHPDAIAPLKHRTGRVQLAPDDGGGTSGCALAPGVRS